MHQTETKKRTTQLSSGRIKLLALLFVSICFAQPPTIQAFEDYWARQIIESDPRVAHYFLDRSPDGEMSQREALIKAYSYQALGWDSRAIESYNFAIEPPYNDPASDWAAFWMGDIIHRSGQVEYLREVFSIRSPPWGRFWLGVWHFVIGEYASAEDIFHTLAIGIKGQAIMRLMAGYLEGLSLSRMGSTERAEEVFQGLLERYPRNLLQGEINYRMGSIAFMQADWEECRQYLDAAMEFYDMSSRKSAHWWADEALFLLGAVDFMENRHLVAMRQFERLQHRFPESPYIGRLPYLSILGKLETRTTHVDKDSLLLTKLSPDLNADVLMRIAYLFMQDGELSAAQDNFVRAAEVAESIELKGESYLFAGECAYRRRRYREAMSFYQLTYEYTEDRQRESGWGIAWCHIRNRRYDDARIYLSGIFSGYDDDFAEHARLVYAETFLTEGRPGRAAQELQDFLKTCRGVVCDEALYDLILCYDAMADTEQVIDKSYDFLRRYRRNRRADNVVSRLKSILLAREEYTRLIQLSDDIEMYSVSRETADRVRMAAERARYALGIYEDPLQITEKFLEKYPDSPLVGEVLMDVGSYLCEIGDYEKGAITFDRLRMRNIPDSIWVEASYRMGVCYLGLGDTSAAEEIFSQLLGEFPSFPLAVRGMIAYGDFFLEQGEIDRAMEAYNEVIEKARDTTQLNIAEYRLALTYEKLGRYPEARILFNNLRDDSTATLTIRRDAFIGLIRVYYQMAEYERGYEMASAVYDTLPLGQFRCDLGEQIGKLAVRLGNVDTALQMLLPMPTDSLSCAGSEDQTVLYDLSLALEFRDRIGDARLVWQWMIETSEDDSIVALAREKINKYDELPE